VISRTPSSKLSVSGKADELAAAFGFNGTWGRGNIIKVIGAISSMLLVNQEYGTRW
jgi:hypothetical protein